MLKDRSGIVQLANLNNLDRIHPIYWFVFLSFFMLVLGLIAKINFIWEISGFLLFIYIAAILVWLKGKI